MKNSYRIYSLSIICLLFSAISYSQNATIKGLVSDSEGNPIFNATVTLQSKNFGSKTTETGSYEITNIPPGSYVLVCKYFGLETFEENLILTVNQTLEKNISLSKSKEKKFN